MLSGTHQRVYKIVPHVTNAIQDWIERVSKVPVDETGEEPDVCIVEVRTFHSAIVVNIDNSLQLGGTVGDIESAPFVEAMRQFQFRVGYENFALIHVSLVPDMHGEQKTKPTQTTIHALRGLGLLPDLVSFSSLCRSGSWSEVCCPDCLPPDSSKAFGTCHQSQDLHVLSCRCRAGPRHSRRFLSLPCSIAPPITRNRSVPSKAPQPGQY